MKIAHNHARRVRTGQNPISVYGVEYQNGVPVSTTPSNGRGNCGPARATNLNSWGAGCPPGVCGPDDLAPNLGRNYAGMQSGCRELAWTIATGSVGGGAAWSGGNIADNSLVTICPTRLIITAIGGDGNGSISSIKFGNEEQLVGGPFAVQMFDPTAAQAIPFVMSCLKAGMPYSVAGTNLDPDTAQTFYITFIGPAVG